MFLPEGLITATRQNAAQVFDDYLCMYEYVLMVKEHCVFGVG